jgi:hypothetical protein
MKRGKQVTINRALGVGKSLNKDSQLFIFNLIWEG